MGVRTVRLEPADEKRLERIRRKTGWTASDVLKRGMQLLDESIAKQPTSSAYDLYASLDLGPGGYALGPSDKVRETVRQAISRRHKT
jgi:hypothetical protein